MDLDHSGRGFLFAKTGYRLHRINLCSKDATNLEIFVYLRLGNFTLVGYYLMSGLNENKDRNERKQIGSVAS